jgi:hypothetical protein
MPSDGGTSPVSFFLRRYSSRIEGCECHVQDPDGRGSGGREYSALRPPGGRDRAGIAASRLAVAAGERDERTCLDPDPLVLDVGLLDPSLMLSLFPGLHVNAESSAAPR